MSTILLVDDDLENRWALQQVLESRGYRVVLAHNGRDALRKVHAEFPELVITDLEMPEMDGGELCRRLKREAAFPDLPVVLLSSMPEPTDRVSSEIGANRSADLIRAEMQRRPTRQR